jgi:hypothetical protein
MTTFKEGDIVAMPGVPFVVKVLETRTCEEPGCDLQTFRYVDPETGDDDWIHSNMFELT